MSKYVQRGAYHYAEFANPKSIYRAHVIDLLQKINDHVEHVRIFEVGAGEGLIMRELSRQGFDCLGCDLDVRAVQLAQEKGNDVRHSSIEPWSDHRFAAVLLCDVLEHVADPLMVVNMAKKMAPVIVIAVPDRTDRHAINWIEHKDVENFFVGQPEWKKVHDSTRHARHLLIFKREP